MNKIGDIVCVLCLQQSDRTQVLLPAQRRSSFNAIDITEHSAQIIGIHQMDSDNMICLCDFNPHSYFSFKVSSYQAKSHNVDDKFLDHKAAFINARMIWVAKSAAVVPQVHLSTPGGCWCVICPKFIQYAESNMPNGCFVCRSCRQTRMYRVEPYLKKNNIDQADVDWIK